MSLEQLARQLGVGGGFQQTLRFPDDFKVHDVSELCRALVGLMM